MYMLRLEIKKGGCSPFRAAAKKEEGRLSIWLPLSPPQGEAAPVQSGLHIVLVILKLLLGGFRCLNSLII